MSKNEQINLGTFITRNENKFLANKIGEEMVMMNMETGDFVSMNNVGADIWAFSERAIAVKELVTKLMDIYDISEEQCRKDITQFLNLTTPEQLFTITNVAVA